MKTSVVHRPKRSRARRAVADRDIAIEDPAPPGSTATRNVLYLVFTLSGLTGLVYEATWTRYLQLFLGHAAYAQVLVLSLFMGGMAAGALFASRLSRTRLAPLVAYAAAEAALGVAALAFHPLFDGVTAYAYSTLLPGTQGSGAATLVQWLLASALILPQSILLGTTFPLMSAAVLRQGAGGSGRVFAMLYFTNSAGAVIGVLLAGFWLIEGYGLHATMIAAGAGNLVAAGAAFLVAKRSAKAAPAVLRTIRHDAVDTWLLAFAFLTAVASFLYEIAWLRMLVLVQGASTHAFETMLSAFILGIALGGLWIRGRIERFGSPVAVLARVQLLMGLAAIATLPAYHFAFDVMAAVLAELPRNDQGYLGYNAIAYLISAGIMVPASFFAGMTLPLITFILYSRGRGESEIGAVYGWNTLGGIAGIAVGSMVLMPQVGAKNMLVIGAALDIAIGVALAALLARGRQLPAPRLTAALATVAIVGVLAAGLGFELDLTRTASGVYRHGQAQIAATAKVLFHADGRTATVDLISFPDGDLAIATNGKTDALINMARANGDRAAKPSADEYTMTLTGALALAYAPDARRAAVIGHGSGLTTQVVLASPAIEEVDVIEIEPEMMRAAKAFLPRVARAYDDPRARYYIEDARAFFARASRRYDFIISEPSNPWISGVASLFTPEFYRQAHRALRPGGLFVQWIQLYDFDRTLVNAIMRGIGSVFSDYVLYAGNNNDLVLVATAAGPMPPISDALFGWPAMRAELEYLDIRSPAVLRLFRVASRRAYAPLLEVGRANSDYVPYLEYGAARARFLHSNDQWLIQLARDAVPALEVLSGFEAPIIPAGPSEGPRYLDRLVDFDRTHSIADALDPGRADGHAKPLWVADGQLAQNARDLPSGASSQGWSAWFSAFFAAAKPLIANGGGQRLANFVASDVVARAMRSAPPDVREKVDFLLLVAKRDLDAIRAYGPPLLDGPIARSDPSFSRYALLVTATACLASAPDAPCRAVIARLSRLPRDSPLIDLLRSHASALQ